MIRYLTSILLLTIIFAGTAQEDTITRRCGSAVYLQQLQKNNPSAYEQMRRTEELIQQKIKQQRSLGTSESDPIVTIPVVVHVIHNNSSGAIGGSSNSNITDAQVQSQIAALTKDYRRKNADTLNTPLAYQSIASDIQVEFCLANTDPNGNSTTGITRHYDATNSFNVMTVFDQVSTIVSWPSDQYLNIWVVNGMSNNVIGFAMFPNSSSAKEDGVIIWYKAFGTVGAVQSKFSLGRTTTHEVGHWLNLYHTWDDQTDCNPSNSDLCEDTPQCKNTNEQSASNCNAIPSSAQCTDRRMIEDYMDYSDDACMNLFTNDQKARIRTALSTDARRVAIQSSLACCILPPLTIAPYSKNMEDGNISSDGWMLNNPTSGVYTKGFELHSESAYGQGNFCTSVRNDSIYKASVPATLKYHYTYTSPFFNIKSTPYPIFRFDWAYSPAVLNGATDSIVVYYTSDCYGNWTALQTLYGSDFKSTEHPRASFIPDAQEWRTTSIDLTPLQSKTGIQFKFVSYSKGINTFYLDNINIAGTSESLQVKVYPNPVTSTVQVETLFEGKHTIQYTIYNALGQQLYTAQDDNVYSMIKTIDLSLFASGMYFIQVNGGGQKQVKRLIKL